MGHPVTTSKNIICAGGGNRGYVYLGAIKAMQAHIQRTCRISFEDFLLGVEGFGGTSIGALIALVLMLRIPLQQFELRFADILSSPQRLVAQPDILTLVNNFGLDNGHTLRMLIGDVIQLGGLDRCILMKDVKRLLNRNFACCATCLQTQDKVYLTHVTTPDMQVVDAVYMSMCVPVVFTPCVYKDRMYIDGTFVENLPDLFPRETTLYFDLGRNPGPIVVDCWTTYLYAILGCGSLNKRSLSEKEIETAHADRIVLLDLPEDILAECPMNLDLSEWNLKQRRMSGYASMLAYLYPQFSATIQSVILFVSSTLLDYRLNMRPFECEEECDPGDVYGC